MIGSVIWLNDEQTLVQSLKPDQLNVTPSTNISQKTVLLPAA